MRIRLIIATLIVVAAVMADVSFAQAAAKETNVTQPSKPKTADAGKTVKQSKPVKVSDTKVTVVSVKGVAHVLTANAKDGKWQNLAAGQELTRLSIIRTGLGAEAVLSFAGRGQVKIKSATKIGLSEFELNGRFMKATVGLKYGSMRAEVDGSTGENDFKVATPVATLSIRGTTGNIAFSGDRGLGLGATRGTWRLAQTPKKGKRKKNVRAGQATDGNLTPSTVVASRKRDTQMGDALGGLTLEETDNLINNGDGRGIFGFDGTPSNITRLSDLKILCYEAPDVVRLPRPRRYKKPSPEPKPDPPEPEPEQRMIDGPNE